MIIATILIVLGVTTSIVSFALMLADKDPLDLWFALSIIGVLMAATGGVLASYHIEDRPETATYNITCTDDGKFEMTS